MNMQIKQFELIVTIFGICLTVCYCPYLVTYYRYTTSQTNPKTKDIKEIKKTKIGGPKRFSMICCSRTASFWIAKTNSFGRAFLVTNSLLIGLALAFFWIRNLSKVFPRTPGGEFSALIKGAANFLAWKKRVFWVPKESKNPIKEKE